MRKLHLDPESLRVDQFVVDSSSHGRGTVAGLDSAPSDFQTMCTCAPSNGYDPTCYRASCATGSPCRRCPWPV